MREIGGPWFLPFGACVEFHPLIAGAGLAKSNPSAVCRQMEIDDVLHGEANGTGKGTFFVNIRHGTDLAFISFLFPLALAAD
jgi:hypothetical protein